MYTNISKSYLKNTCVYVGLCECKNLKRHKNVTITYKKMNSEKPKFHSNSSVVKLSIYTNIYIITCVYTQVK